MPCPRIFEHHIFAQNFILKALSYPINQLFKNSYGIFEKLRKEIKSVNWITPNSNIKLHQQAHSDICHKLIQILELFDIIKKFLIRSMWMCVEWKWQHLTVWFRDHIKTAQTNVWIYQGYKDTIDLLSALVIKCGK